MEKLVVGAEGVDGEGRVGPEGRERVSPLGFSAPEATSTYCFAIGRTMQLMERFGSWRRRLVNSSTFSFRLTFPT